MLSNGRHDRSLGYRPKNPSFEILDRENASKGEGEAGDSRGTGFWRAAAEELIRGAVTVARIV